MHHVVVVVVVVAAHLTLSSLRQETKRIQDGSFINTLRQVPNEIREQIEVEKPQYGQLFVNSTSPHARAS